MAGEPPGLVQPASDPAPLATVCTCPMHPDIRQPGPGACPKCGTALEPLMPSAEDEEMPELSFRRGQGRPARHCIANALRLRGTGSPPARQAPATRPSAWAIPAQQARHPT